ncbi:MAG: gamma-glutamylcyclotransferase family protein [Myxococcota bacterium]
MERLFVYGTLAPGRPNAHILADVPGTWTPGYVRGRLVDEGWGAAEGYPGIIIEPEAPQVAGFIFSSPALHQHWVRLDDFEGDGYVRVEVQAKLDSGPVVSAYIYALRPASS